MQPIIPGEFLEDYMLAHGMTLAELERRSQLSARTLCAVLRGKEKITADVAQGLAEAFPQKSISFWLDLEKQYQGYLHRRYL